MKFSTKVRYGVRAMVDLAVRNSGTPVLVKDIASRQEISGRYLEHLMLVLKKAGFIRSIRGSKGGYVLARDPSDVTMRDIVEALEGSLSPVECIEDGRVCSRSGTCAARDMWTRVKTGMVRALESVTLKDLADAQKNKAGRTGMVYEI